LRKKTVSINARERQITTIKKHVSSNLFLMKRKISKKEMGLMGNNRLTERGRINCDK